MNATVRIGNRVVGDGASCFIIAEAGSNHNGNIEQAKRLIEVAAGAGADAVKFQLFRARKLYPKTAGRSEYLKSSRPIYDIIAEMEMPEHWVPELSRYSQKCGLIFLASVFDEELVDWLDSFVPAHKIASYEMTHLPLIRHVAGKGKPVIISTGAAHLGEIAETVGAVRQAGNPPLILMQCTAAYPAPMESLNVRAIATMKSQFGIPVGLSDHSRDPVVGPLMAVAMGANLIEKHFTLSNTLPGPDHCFAVEPDELRLMVEKVHEAERALGTGEKTVHLVEEELRQFARRSIFSLRDISPGEPLTKENIAVLRCGNLTRGLEPSQFEAILYKRAQRAIIAESTIQPNDYA